MTARLEALKIRAHQLKTETYALCLAARDPRTPWYAKLLLAGIVAYAFSPIDLIPDFLPVLGYLDDLILLPMVIALAVKLIPRSVLDDCRALARENMDGAKPVSWIAGVVVVATWLLISIPIAMWVYKVL